MDDWYVRESMWFLDSLAASLGGMGPGCCGRWLVAGGAIERLLQCLLDAGASRTGGVPRSMLRPAVPSRHSPLYVAQDAVPSLDVSNARECDATPVGAERALSGRRRSCQIARGRRLLRASTIHVC